VLARIVNNPSLPERFPTIYDLPLVAIFSIASPHLAIAPLGMILAHDESNGVIGHRASDRTGKNSDRGLREGRGCLNGEKAGS
jgi:hypothetical protein